MVKSLCLRIRPLLWSALDLAPSLQGEKTDRSEGFSLLEVLVALAIMSVASLGLFQSLSSMLEVSSKSVRYTEGTLNNAIIDRSLSQLVRGLVTEWPDGPDSPFKGRETEFEGLSTRAIEEDNFGVMSFTLQLRENQQAGRDLVYLSANQEIYLARNLPDSSHFLYRYVDGRWSDVWPLPPSRDESELEELLPFETKAMPVAIALKSSNAALEWIYRVDKYRYLPDRLEIDR